MKTNWLIEGKPNRMFLIRIARPNPLQTNGKEILSTFSAKPRIILAS
jgi:hypothetical protein